MRKRIGPKEFQDKAAKVRFVLLARVADDPNYAGQFKALAALARTFSDELEVCLVDEDQSDYFRDRYGVAGMPTYVLLECGEEKGRLLGLQSLETLAAFVMDGRR